MVSVRSQAGVAALDTQNLRFHAVGSERLMRLLPAARAGRGRCVAAFRLDGALDLIDDDWHHSTSNWMRARRSAFAPTSALNPPVPEDIARPPTEKLVPSDVETDTDSLTCRNRPVSSETAGWADGARRPANAP